MAASYYINSKLELSKRIGKLHSFAEEEGVCFFHIPGETITKVGGLFLKTLPPAAIKQEDRSYNNAETTIKTNTSWIRSPLKEEPVVVVVVLLQNTRNYFLYNPKEMGHM